MTNRLDGGAALRAKHGVTDDQVLVDADDKNTVTVICRFPSLQAGRAFASDPQLQEDMGKASVSGPPRIEFNVEP